MKKFLMVLAVVAVLRLGADAGAFRHVVKPVVKGSSKAAVVAAKASVKGAKSAAHAVKVVLD